MVTAKIIYFDDGGEVANVKFSEDTGKLEIDSDEYNGPALRNLFQNVKHTRYIGHYPFESGKTDGYREETFTGTQSEDHFEAVLRFDMGGSYDAIDIEVTPN